MSNWQEKKQILAQFSLTIKYTKWTNVMQTIRQLDTLSELANSSVNDGEN